MLPEADCFAPYLRQWHLMVDGEMLSTPCARLLPVRTPAGPAMLKVSHAPEEQRGYDVLTWWRGEGAALVFKRAGPALLMERADSVRSLITMSQDGCDDEASRILCQVAQRLHRAHRGAALPAALEPLPERFEALRQSTSDLLAPARSAMHALLAAPRDGVVLHGDIHHANVLDFGARGWLAIDPKGLLGESGFDLANLFCNPDATIALCPARFQRRVEVVSATADIDRQRLLQWILAWSGLSAAWHLEDATDPDVALGVGRMAQAALQH